ncbi:protein of unknown function [Burkholderia multivorans]
MPFWRPSNSIKSVKFSLKISIGNAARSQGYLTLNPKIFLQSASDQWKSTQNLFFCQRNWHNLFIGRMKLKMDGAMSVLHHRRFSCSSMRRRASRALPAIPRPLRMQSTPLLV